MARAVENSLKALGTDYIDLYQLHSPKPRWPTEQTMGHLLRLRDSGKIRYIGVSNFSSEQTLEDGAPEGALGPLEEVGRVPGRDQRDLGGPLGH